LDSKAERVGSRFDSPRLAHPSGRARRLLAVPDELSEVMKFTAGRKLEQDIDVEAERVEQFRARRELDHVGRL
jgi:hypothetical protein